MQQLDRCNYSVIIGANWKEASKRVRTCESPEVVCFIYHHPAGSRLFHLPSPCHQPLLDTHAHTRTHAHTYIPTENDPLVPFSARARAAGNVIKIKDSSKTTTRASSPTPAGQRACLAEWPGSKGYEAFGVLKFSRLPSGVLALQLQQRSCTLAWNSTTKGCSAMSPVPHNYSQPELLMRGLCLALTPAASPEAVGQSASTARS